MEATQAATATRYALLEGRALGAEHPRVFLAHGGMEDLDGMEEDQLDEM